METQTSNTPPAKMSGEGGNKNILMAILAYLGPLIIVSYVVAKDDMFVKFHIKQGLVLLVITIAIWIFSSLLWTLYPIWSIINFAVFVLAIVGIVNAAKGSEKELPLVGQLAKHFPI